MSSAVRVENFDDIGTTANGKVSAGRLLPGGHEHLLPRPTPRLEQLPRLRRREDRRRALGDERLTGRLFTRSRNSQDRSWSASKTQAGRLIRLFGGAIDAMVRAREDDRDPFDVLDEEIGWDRLVASREEIAALGDLATQDPLSLATQRYAQLRRFAPAFLDAFEFDAPAAGHDLPAAVTLLRELNRTGKRTLPDIVPMPFPSQHWRAVILHNVMPLGWEHIVLTGDYDWNSGAAERTNARPLNLYPARIRA